MKIEYALLADAAQAVGGKVFVLGGDGTCFDRRATPRRFSLRSRSASGSAPVKSA